MAKPEKKIKVGNITATVWNNIHEVDGQIKEMKSVKLEKNYKDKEGNWKSCASFSLYELPKAILALSKAFSDLTVKEE